VPSSLGRAPPQDAALVEAIEQLEKCIAHYGGNHKKLCAILRKSSWGSVDGIVRLTQK
jgi:hypothetical protein